MAKKTKKKSDGAYSNKKAPMGDKRSGHQWLGQKHDWLGSAHQTFGTGASKSLDKEDESN